jgi:hypothetical protein
LTDSLVQAQKLNASWVNSPEDIARHFFTAISADRGPMFYKITRESISPTRCKVTVLEKGAIEDKVFGQRHIIYFQSTDGIWKIFDLKYALKRRD